MSRITRANEYTKTELEHLKEDKEEFIPELKAEINGIHEERDAELELRN